MKYKKPTYEEYCNASEFAKLRYKFGVYIQLVAFILLILLVLYTISNVEEMKSNPIDYAEEKMGAMCIASLNTIEDGSNRNIKNIEEEW